MLDLFISYRRKDEKIAKLIAERLRAHGKSVWWDREQLDDEKVKRNKKMLPHGLIDGIDEVHRLALLFGDIASKHSPWIRMEISYAEASEKKILHLFQSTDEDKIPRLLRQFRDGEIDSDNPGLIALIDGEIKRLLRDA